MTMKTSAVSGATATDTAPIESVLRQHAEQQFAEELAELAKLDDRQRPPNWVLSPWVTALISLLVGRSSPARELRLRVTPAT